MPTVFEDALKSRLAKKETLPCYMLFGDDGYLKKMYSGKIGKMISSPDDYFNYSVFDGDCDLQDVYDAVMQFPMMADKKFVELCDFNFEKADKTEFDKLISLIEEIPDTATLVIRFDNIEVNPKKNKKFDKLSSAVFKAGGICVNLNHRTTAELAKMLCDGAARRGARLDTSTARYMIETAGDDINILKNELIKLCFYVNGGTVTAETVDKVCAKTVEASVFNMSKFILSGDTAGALNCLNDLFYMKNEPMSILYNISSVYTDMYRVLSAKKSGAGQSQVAELYNYKGKEFLLDKASQNLRRVAPEKIAASLDEICRADKALKSFGANPEAIMEELVVRLIFIIK